MIAVTFPVRLGMGRDIASLVLVAAGSFATAAAQTPRPGAFEQPSPRFAVRVEPSVWIPMRDGVRLSADLYFPVKPDSEKLPVIAIRTPYNKRRGADRDAGNYFAGQGFVVAVEDFRGRFESEGHYEFNRFHRNDGFDTIEWLARQPWSNGKVGTYGCSYVGEVQLYQAPSRPPHLAAMVPQAAGSMVGSAGGYYHNAQDLGSGAWGLGLLFPWWFENGGQVFYHPPASSLEQSSSFSRFFRTGPELPVIDYNSLYRTLPLIDMMNKAARLAGGRIPNEYELFLEKQNDLTDPWWKDRYDYLTDQDRIDAPSLFIESWNDFTASATLYVRGLFERTAVSETARQNQFIIVSPSSHCQSERMQPGQMIGDQEAGDPRFGHWDIYRKWFDRWLKGVDNGVTAMPKVQYYLLGKNQWRAAPAWPLPNTERVAYYLESGGHAATHSGDGVLSTSAPPAAAVDRYTYDPADPVPSVGVNDYWGGKPITDQRLVTARRDVLVYTSAPVTQGFEMTGDIEVVLYVSSSAKDTDFAVKLVDVYPDGQALNIRENIIRARYRNGRDRPAELMEPGQVYEVKIRLGAYSNWVGPGHRIQLLVTSSSFPRWDRNLNTGGKNYDEVSWVVADNAVHHSAQYRSRLILPVIR
jgi:putative CocE/NonD family hydrolase